ncbi:MAG TPA: hypothetical protein VNJ53_03275 [Gaiellaceae bacterium]|nr:hypothetical protein [Gaiellaceae bacterium]
MTRLRVVSLGVALALAATALAAVLLARGGKEASSSAGTGTQVSGPQGGAAQDPLTPRAGTDVHLGRFTLRSGRVVRLRTTETEGGHTCLVEADAEGEGSACFRGGLFGTHRASFTISSNGGPRRFSELRLVGVAAPEVATVVVETTSGERNVLELNERNAFLFESTAAELGRDAVPSALVLYGRNGRLVERIEIPHLR